MTQRRILTKNWVSHESGQFAPPCFNIIGFALSFKRMCVVLCLLISHVSTRDLLLYRHTAEPRVVGWCHAETEGSRCCGGSGARGQLLIRPFQVIPIQIMCSIRSCHISTAATTIGKMSPEVAAGCSYTKFSGSDRQRHAQPLKFRQLPNHKGRLRLAWGCSPNLRWDGGGHSRGSHRG